MHYKKRFSEGFIDVNEYQVFYGHKTVRNSQSAVLEMKI
jgi:hypothetical protein